VDLVEVNPCALIERPAAERQREKAVVRGQGGEGRIVAANLSATPVRSTPTLNYGRR
jgi:hypothetical protein